MTTVYAVVRRPHETPKVHGEILGIISTNAAAEQLQQDLLERGMVTAVETYVVPDDARISVDLLVASWER